MEPTPHGVPVLGDHGRPIGPTRDREAWKAARGWRLGSTDSAKILGKDEYSGPWQPWDRIVLGEWDEQEEPGADIRRGNRQEGPARTRFHEVTGLEIRELGMIHHPKDRRIVTDVDGLIVRPEEWPEAIQESPLWSEVLDQDGPGWLELKVPRVGRFYEYKEAGLPLRYSVQGQHHGMVSGLAWGFFAFYTPEYDDVIAFPVLTDADFGSWLFAALRGWYEKHVEARVRPVRFAPPPPRWPSKIVGAATVRDDDEWVDTARLVAMRHFELQEAQAAYDETEAELLKLLAEDDTHVAGGGLTVKRASRSQHRWDPKAFRAAVKLAQQEGDTERLQTIDPDDEAFFYDTKPSESVKVVVRENPAELMQGVA